MLFDWHVTNTSDKAYSVTVALTWKSGWLNSPAKGLAVTAKDMSTTKTVLAAPAGNAACAAMEQTFREDVRLAYGVAAAPGAAGTAVENMSDFDPDGKGEDFLEELKQGVSRGDKEEKGKKKKKPLRCKQLAMAVRATRLVKPDEKAEGSMMRFAVAWHMPEIKFRSGKRRHR